MKCYPLWQIILNQDIENIHNYKFNYTYDDSKYESNGDIYATIHVGGLLATYIIDYGAKMITYDTSWLLNNKYPICEVLKFDRGKSYFGTYEVLVFNESSKAHASFYGEEYNMHYVKGPATFDLLQDKDGLVGRFSEEYYINGKQISKKVFDRIQKIKQITSSKL